MLNNITIEVRLTKDAEYSQVGDKSVTKISGACQRDYKKQGEDKPGADFFQIDKWNLSKEFVEKQLKKGKRIIVQGRVEDNTWEDDNGKKHYDKTINAEKLYLAEYVTDSEAAEE